jgi:uncharacterized protein with FMN-binding domain
LRRVLLAVITTVTALVLLLSFKTHSVGVAQAVQSTVARAPASGTSVTPSASPSASPSAPSTTSTAASTTVTGDAANTRYGPVQVQITVANGKITAAQAVEYPQDNPRDAEINSSAIPQLEQETVSASSTHIDTVSGATYTSDGYLTSLQSAINKAGL